MPAFLRLVFIPPLLLAAVFVYFCSVQIASAQDSFGFNAEMSTRGLFTENPSTGDIARRTQYRLAASATVRFTDDACFSLTGQVVTGQGYGNHWERIETSGTLNGGTLTDDDIAAAEEFFHMNVDRLYVTAACLAKNLVLQAGALPVQSEGRFGIRGSGWVDGMRVRISPEGSNTVFWITGGEVTDGADPHLFNRKNDGANFYQFVMTRKVSENMDFTADVTSHDDNEYLRLAMDWATEDLMRFMDVFAVETVVTNGDGSGHLLLAGKTVGRWNIEIAHSNNKQGLQEPGSLQLPVRGFFGNGKNGHLFVTRPINDRWSFRTRLRDGDAGPRYEIRFDWGLTSTSDTD